MRDSHASSGKPLPWLLAQVEPKLKAAILPAAEATMETPMPEIGAASLAGSIASIFDDLRRKMDGKRESILKAADEVSAEVDGYDGVVRVLNAERDKVREHVNQLLGNNPPATSEK